MSSDDNYILCEGVIIEIPRGAFKVLTTENQEVLAKLSGKMKKNSIRVCLNDRVQVKVSCYDSSRGYIVFRYKD